jgi:serine protease Do
VADLREHGSVTRGWLGVQIQTIDEDMASGLGLEKTEGAIISNVEAGSPAEKAGFKVGDVVTKMNGEVVKSSRELARMVAALTPGQKAEFTVWRGGAETALTAEVSKRASDPQLASLGDTHGETESLGLALAELSPTLKQRYNLEEDVAGVVVTRVMPGSEAADKGLQPGDIVAEVNGKPVTSAADLTKSVAEARSAGKEAIVLRIMREGAGRFVALKLKQS